MNQSTVRSSAFRWTTLVALATLLAAGATAAPVTYLFQGTATGTLGASSFTDELYTFTFLGDTSNFTLGFGGQYVPTTGTFAIANTGSGTVLSTQVNVFAVDGGVTFFSGSPLGGNIIAYAGAYLASALTSSFGPVVATSAGTQLQTLATDLGGLTFTRMGAPNSFQSIVGAEVPEPSTWALTILGIGFSLVVRRKRQN